MSTQAWFLSLHGLTRKPGGEGCLLWGVMGLSYTLPLSPARQHQTGSSSLFPFSQTFQRMGDLLEKLNTDIREWGNWIQVVRLLGCKKTVPLSEYYLIGKVSPSLSFYLSMFSLQAGCLSLSPSESSSETSWWHSMAFQHS